MKSNDIKSLKNDYLDKQNKNTHNYKENTSRNDFSDNKLIVYCEICGKRFTAEDPSCWVCSDCLSEISEVDCEI